MDSLISRLTNEPLFSEVALTSDLIIYGEDSLIESLLLVQLISIAEEILEQHSVDLDLFSQIFSNNRSLTLGELESIISDALST